MTFLYKWSSWVVILSVVLVVVALAVGGLVLARRFVLSNIKYRGDINDAISGALAAIGVFYGITLGLIAVEAWNRHSIAENIAAREAAAIQTLYLNIKLIRASNGPDTAELTPAMEKVSDYLRAVICVTWPTERDLEKKRKWEEQRKSPLPKECDLRLEVPRYEEENEEIIKGFKIEFKSKKKACAVLIIPARSDSEKWTIIGFGDAGDSRTGDPNQELLEELKKKPLKELLEESKKEPLKKTIVDLALSSLRQSEEVKALRAIHKKLAVFEPQTEGEKVRYSATIRSFNDLSELRRMRIDAAEHELSALMWTIIICGAVMTIFTVYLLQFKDAKLHYLVVSLSSGLLALVILIILLFNRPFLGQTGIEPDSYIQVSWIMHMPKYFKRDMEKDWQRACSNKSLGTSLEKTEEGGNE